MMTTTGHDTECMCPACLWADMNDFTGQDEPLPNAPTGQRTRYKAPGTASGYGTVRYASVKQISFIRHLLATRDLSRMVWLTGSEAIRRDINRLPDNEVQVSLRGASDIIDRLLGCPELPKAPAERPVSPKQITFIKSLCERKGIADLSAEVTTAKQASSAIDRLLSLADAPKTAPSVELTEGLYRRADGGIVLTQRSKQGRLYGKLYNAETKTFDYAPGLLTGELTRMTLDEAKDLSVEMGCCCRCGRELTATVDGVPPRERYIGPICAGRLS